MIGFSKYPKSDKSRSKSWKDSFAVFSLVLNKTLTNHRPGDVFLESEGLIQKKSRVENKRQTRN